MLNLERWSDRQREAICTRNQNVLVSAGAGSGKTSVLVERVVACLLDEQPIEVEQLLVVTFTEAAAAEMKERIGDRLQALVVHARQCGERELVKRLARQYALLDQAQISTLHSFCLDIVERNFLSLHLDPGFRLLDEQENVVMQSEIVRELLEEFITTPGFQTVLSMFAQGDPLKLVPLVYKIDEFARSQPNPTAWLHEMAGKYPTTHDAQLNELAFTPAFRGWIERAVQDAGQLLWQALELAQSVEELDAYAANIQNLLTQQQVAMNELAADANLTVVNRHLHAMLSQKSPRAKDHPDKKQVQALRTQALDLIKQTSEVLDRGEQALLDDLVTLAPAIRGLCWFVQAFQERCLQIKLSSGRIDFQDLEHLALQALLDTTTGEQDALKERFVEIFVDEYQDTSPIQDALIHAIARPSGNVFVVGDVKQSIYRFRMAEPKLFLNQYQQLGHHEQSEPGKVIDLADNYRSRREVVNCVNFVFAQLFAMETSGFSYDARAAMHASAEYPPLPNGEQVAVPVELHFIERNSAEQVDNHPTDDVGEAIDLSATDMSNDDFGSGDDDLSAIEKEALVIGQRMLEFMGRRPGFTRVQVWDKGRKQYRPIEYRDMVVLLRSVKGRLNILLDVFRNMDIPAYGATASGFFDTLEVQWVMALLSALDNPRRELAFVTLLKSPFVGFDDETLAHIRVAGRGNYLDALRRIIRSRAVEHDTLVNQLTHFWRTFTTWRQMARQEPVETVLRTIIKETGFLHYVTGMSDGLRRKANVEAVLDRARSFDANSTDGVFGFVQQADEAFEHEIDAGEAHMVGESEDVVRIMTIHRSKGLEFPVVFVADIGKQMNRAANDTNFMLHRDLGFGPTLFDAKTLRRWRTMASIALEEQERCEYLAEEARVLYVAMTRARERLIFVGSARHLDKVIQKEQQGLRNHIDITLPKTLFLGARTYLDWLVAAMSRHPTCRQGWVMVASDINSGGLTMPSVSKAANLDSLQPFVDFAQVEVMTRVWNVQDGCMLPYDLLKRSSDLDNFTQQYDDVGLLVEALKQAHASEMQTGTIRIVDAVGEVTTVPSKVSATEIRRLWVAMQNKGAKADMGYRASAEKLLADPTFIQQPVVAGQALGTAFHTVMQHLDFKTDPSLGGVNTVLHDLHAQGILSDDELVGLDVEYILGWLTSPLGQRVAQATRVLREQPFFHRIEVTGSASPYRTSRTHVNNQYAIAQGVIDCLAEESDRWLLVDYKTDQITADMVTEKAKEYEAQVATYLAAVHQLTRLKPVEAYLYFVKPQVAVRIGNMDVSKVFSTR